MIIGATQLAGMGSQGMNQTVISLSMTSLLCGLVLSMLYWTDSAGLEKATGVGGRGGLTVEFELQARPIDKITSRENMMQRDNVETIC
ncbi:MAG: hypothetical protein IIC85_00425 [Chloroflexi bacterium]|nr:hypothetical protein [Chloroflexota bacterium]